MYLTCHSYYSLHYGTLSIDKLVAQAQAQGLSYLGLADINTSAGVFEFVQQCQQAGIKPIVGIAFWQGGQHLYTGVAHNHEGLHYLNSFLTKHNLSGKPLPAQAPVLPYTAFLYPYTSKLLPPDALPEGHYVSLTPQQAVAATIRLRKADRLVLTQPIILGAPADFLLHCYLVAIGRNILLTQLQKDWVCSRTAHWLAPSQEASLRQQFPELCRQTDQLAAICDFTFDFGQRLNKKVFGASPAADRLQLTALTRAGMLERYGPKHAEAATRVERELKVIFDLGFTAYYLITWDLISYSMRKGYYHVGRGSGANSIVAFCLRITDVDPIELDLYFERFLNPKRSSPPDFDIDYSWTDREDVQRYLLSRYEDGHAALLGATITLQGRSIIRELGKVRGLPKAEIDRIIREPSSPYVKGSQTFAKMVRVGYQMESFPAAHSIHAGGVIIADKPLSWYTALIMPPKGLPTAELDMYEAERIGLDKFDILSQRGIGHINEAVSLVQQHHGIAVDIHNIPALKADPQIADKLYQGDTIGCFYVESPAMRQLLLKLRCREYITLVAASSIIRPGVASSGMMNAYIQRYNDPASVEYLHPVMEEHLGETYGVMVYQEDVLKVCHHYAGMDLSDADILRRAMSGKNRGTNAFERIRQQFFDGATALGRPPETTQEIWRQVSSFGGYSFCKAHSASYAVESYQSMHLKTYYPLPFYVAVINNFGGFYSTWVYVHEAQKAGGRLHTPCVNHSQLTTAIVDLEGDAADVFVGLVHIQGLEKKWMEAIISDRVSFGPYLGIEDLAIRLPMPFDQLRLLVKTGALDFTGQSRKLLLMKAHLLAGQPVKTSLGLPALNPPLRIPPLQEPPDQALDNALDEVELLGFPVSLGWFDLVGTSWRPSVTKRSLPSYLGQYVKVMGKLVDTKPVTTKHGERMLFGTFLDHEGEYIDTVHFPPALKAWPVYGHGIYLIFGRVTTEFNVYSVEVAKCKVLPGKIGWEV